MSRKPKLLVMGATGNVGGALYRLLAADQQDVRVVVRDRAHPSVPAGAEVVVADLDERGAATTAAAGVERAFLIGGRRDMPGLLADLRSAGVKHVVLLTSRSVIGRTAGNAISEMWAGSEEAVFASGMSWTVLRPSGFMSNALRWRPQLRAGDEVRTPFADVPIAAIHTQDLAAVAALALSDLTLSSRCLELSGPKALTAADQTAVLGRVLGRHLRIAQLTEEETRVELGRAFPPQFVDAMFRFFAHGEFDDARVVGTIPELLKRPALGFEQWAAEHAQDF